MPSGITQPIYDGEPITPREFLIRCAGQFTAYVMQRDMDAGAPRPRHLEPPDYHRKELIGAAAKIVTLNHMTPAERDEMAVATFQTEHDRWALEREHSRRMAADYRAMILALVTWDAGEMQSVKDYAIDHLRDSWQHDVHDYDDTDSKWLKEPVQLSGDEWFAQEMAAAEASVVYHREHWEEDQQRTAERNEWIDKFYEALDRLPT